MFPTLLAKTNCIPIYEQVGFFTETLPFLLSTSQVYANHRQIAVAAGEFLNCKVFQQAGAKTKEDQAKLILELVQFFIEGEVSSFSELCFTHLKSTERVIILIASAS